MTAAADADIEHALRAAWSLDALAAYADHLQLRGDPRGELIALDLHPLTDHHAWRKRRRAALAEWLGELADRAGHLVQHGFIHELREGSFARDLLDSPLGQVVRGFTTWGHHERVAQSLTRLAARPRPWLARLTIAYWSDEPLPATLRDRVLAALPNLEELRLAGKPPFAQLDRPIGESAWSLPEHELQLLLDAIETLPDCNALYAFSDSVPVLVARAYAAGLVELDGPFVRRAELERGALDVIPPDPEGFVRVRICSPADTPWLREPLLRHQRTIAGWHERQLTGDRLQLLARSLAQVLEVVQLGAREATAGALAVERLATFLDSDAAVERGVQLFVR